MYQIAISLIILVCVLLILIVLVQNSKGGGLVSNFSSSNQMLGVKKTADKLEQFTWGFAIALLVLSLVASMTFPRQENVEQRATIEDATPVTSPQAPQNYQEATPITEQEQE